MTQILYVEDSKMAHAVVVELFQKKGLGYTVDWAATVSEAMKMLGEKQYDLLLLDYILPDGTGLDLLEKAKATPVVFFTGQGSEKVAVQAMKLGVYDYVTKDFDGAYMEILPAVIKRTLQAVRLKKEKEDADIRMRDSEERYRSLFEQSPYGIVLIDPETQMPVEFNETAYKQLGYSREEFARLRIQDYEAIETPEQIKARIGNILLVLRNDFETRHRTKGGDIRNVMVTVQIIEAHGKPFFNCIFHDITEFKRAEDEILKLNADLEQKVIERTAQLEAANKSLETFSYSVSHDLRAPLRAITGFAGILMEDYADKLGDEGRRLLNVVENNVNKMGQLIDDILAFSRAGRQGLQLVEIDMEGLATEVVEELRLTFTGRQVQIEIKPLPPAICDRAALHQVFTNLISNAIKFTRPKETAVIEIGTTDDVRDVRNEFIYYIKDNGAGFDMDSAGKLFGVFQRLHSTEEFEGTGVGLSIVKTFITKHGGRVWAEGKAGEGATFYFTLPKLSARSKKL